MRSQASTTYAPAQSKWSAPLREAGLLLMLAVVVTSLSWFLRSDGLPFGADPVVYELELSAPLIGIEEAMALYDEGEYLFVDTRFFTDGEFQTIPGAFFIREASFDDDLLEYFDFMTNDDHFILFGEKDLFSVSNVAGRMKDRGYQNLFILKNGLTDWLRADGEISHRTGGEQ